MTLDTPVRELHRVGKTLEKNLIRLGIQTAGDLLRHFPFRYEDFSRIVPIRDAREGFDVTVKGTVELIANKRSHRKRVMITEAIVSDDTGQMRVVWFGQPFIAKNLQTGDMVFFSGAVKSDMFGIVMVGPSYEKVKTSPSYPSPTRGGRPTGASAFVAGNTSYSFSRDSR